MGVFNRVYFTFVLLSWMCASCTALLCFSCDNNLVGCGDHFALPNTAAANCQGTCIKRRGERYSNQVRVVEVTRTCVAQQRDGCSNVNWNGITVEACACNTDYCNAVGRTHSAPLHLMAQLLLCLVPVLLG